MPIEVTIRSDEITKRTQDYVKFRGEEIVSEFSGVEHVHITLDKVKHMYNVHAFVQGKNHIRIEAEEEVDNINTAIDQAMEKLNRQLRKIWDKSHDHKTVMKHVEKHRGEIPADEVSE